jgi:hypothetical protein
MKFIIPLIIVFSTFLSCNSDPFDCGSALTDKDLTESYGIPESDTLLLSGKTRLYEHQNGLLEIYNDLKPDDSIWIIEKTWTSDPHKLIRWYNLDGEKPVDCLTWNSDKQKF